MKFTYCFLTALLSALLSVSCQNKESKAPQPSQNKSAIIKGTPCDINLSGIHFTKSINGADTLAKLEGNKIILTAGAKKDYFSDPDGQLSNNTAPLLLAKVDKKTVYINS